MSAHAIESRDDVMRHAKSETLISPRFYKTDYAAMNRLDMSSVRAAWDAMLAEYEGDNNHDHFQRDASFKDEIRQLPPELQQEFLDFLVSSITSEYSGCVLYNEIRKHVDNPDIKQLMTYLTRDESRHANFINASLRDYGLGVDLANLKATKAYTYFKPKYIYYATYLSEKIGYARYITIYRQLERHPDRRFHPIFKWFERWCNDEFRHGESFALIMRANPQLLRGANLLWVRFFLLAVYATMFVRDHTRPALHIAMGLDPDTYDYRVFDITTEISKQVFPISLDTNAPAFRAGLNRLLEASDGVTRAKAQGGVIGLVKRAGWTLAAVGTFAKLYCMPVKRHDLPAQMRVAPAW
jgi:magnesium-protoporphyrin IX monomethyl ester (oxidative) cyclase